MNRYGAAAAVRREWNLLDDVAYPPWRMHVVTSGEDKDDAVQPSGLASASEAAEVVTRESPRRPLRAVVVEDEMIISMDLQMLLEDLQVEVVGTAISADEAVAVVAAERPDVITMDINIQGDRDGVTAANEIFQKYGIRSIFISAYGDATTKARAETAKPFGWVRKPIDKADLDQILQFVRLPND